MQLGDGKVLEGGEGHVGQDEEEPDAGEDADHVAAGEANALAIH